MIAVMPTHLKSTNIKGFVNKLVEMVLYIGKKSMYIFTCAVLKVL